MVTAILPDTDTPFKTLKNNGFGRLPCVEPLGDFGPDVEAEPTYGGGAIMILIGLGGICSVQIIADESTEEEELRERLTAVWLDLESIHKTIKALNAEHFGVGG